MSATIWRYPFSMRVLHWLMAALVIGLLAVGLYMTGAEGELRGLLYRYHKALGLTVLALVILRYALRQLSPVPPLPYDIPRWRRYAAGAVHTGLYLCMLLMPATGYVMSIAGGHGIDFFGVPVPALLDVNKPLAGTAHNAHYILSRAFIVLLALHIGAVIDHQRRGTALLKRMT